MLEGHVCSICPSHDIALSNFRRSGRLCDLLILRSLVHQLFDAPIAQHYLHQRALRFPFLDVGEGEFDSVEMKTIVVGFGRMMMTPCITARRLARARKDLGFRPPA